LGGGGEVTRWGLEGEEDAAGDAEGEEDGGDSETDGAQPCGFGVGRDGGFDECDGDGDASNGVEIENGDGPPAA